MLKKLIIVITIFILIIFNNSLIYGSESRETITDGENKKTVNLNLYARSAALIDAKSGRVLYERNAYDEVSIASTTKIMTCIIALEYGNLTDTVKVSSYAASMPNVQLHIKEGEEYNLEDLLYSLMLESHNDSAAAIAEHIGGSVEGFAELMNSKAKDIGAFNTNFVTPNGLDAVGQHSTAYDIGLIGAYAIENEDFIKITNTNNHVFTDKNGSRNHSVSNKNAFLSMMDGALGIKTGFTSQAGYCFVGALKKDNIKLISVVLASGPNKACKWSDTRKLMLYAIQNHTYKILFEPLDSYKLIEVTNGKKSSVDTYIDGSFSALMREDENVEYFYKHETSLDAPVKKNQIVGTVEATIDGEIVWTHPIRVKERIEKIDLKFSFDKVLKTLFSFDLLEFIFQQ